MQRSKKKRTEEEIEETEEVVDQQADEHSETEEGIASYDEDDCGGGECDEEQGGGDDDGATSTRPKRAAAKKSGISGDRWLPKLLREMLSDDDLDAEEDEQVRKLIGTKKKRVVVTTKNLRHNAERDFYKSKKMMNEKKKLNTLKRAIKPKAKQHQRGSRHNSKADEEANALQLEPHVAHPLMLKMFDELLADEDPTRRTEAEAKKTLYDLFFIEWETAYFKSKNDITDELQRYGSIGAMGAGITRFFAPSDASIIASLDRIYRNIYHTAVTDIDSNTKVRHIPIYASVEALHTKTPTEVKLVAVGPPTEATHQDGTEQMCPTCKIPLLYDEQHAESACPQCGQISKSSKDKYKVTFSDTQTCSRGAAPYERIAHVSSLFSFSFICYLLTNNWCIHDITGKYDLLSR